MSESGDGMSWSPHSTVEKTGNQISTEMDGEEIILHLDSDRYYGLNDVGTLIWSLVQEERTVGDIRTAIVEEYEIDPERCERDLDTFLTELSEQGLIEITDETDS